MAYESLPVRGAWVEILSWRVTLNMSTGRSPCGERGLKWGRVYHPAEPYQSLPVRGAWVEISLSSNSAANRAGRSPCGERGLKCGLRSKGQHKRDVAPRAGSVG